MDRKKKGLWKYYGLAETGTRHKESELLCQDRIAYRCKGRRQAIALVDGVGKTDKNILAGEKIAQYLVDAAIKHFVLLNQKDNQEIKEILLRNIYRIIEGLMKEYSLPKEEFASTLMAIVLDHESNSYCAIHLGDGIIASVEDEINILSYPENGFFVHQTYLTISENALQKMKIIHGDINRQVKFALISDGAYDLKNLDESLKKVIENESFETCDEDDMGFICLKK